MTLTRRLDRLATVRPRAVTVPATSFDARRLSFAEQIELDDLLRPLAPLPGERWDLEPLTLTQLERAHTLVAKGHGCGDEPV